MFRRSFSTGNRRSTTHDSSCRRLLVGATLTFASAALLLSQQTNAASIPSTPPPPPTPIHTPSHDTFPTQKLKTPTHPNKQPVVLVACGSFSPITVMHLRVLEMAKDYYDESDRYEVVGGYLSPVGDMYGKAGMESAKHRVTMSELAVKSNDWVMVDNWESKQKEWITTVKVLEHFEEEVRKKYNKPVRVVFVCGSDLLDSFIKPGVWKDEDIVKICSHYGIAVVTREGAHPDATIWSSSLLYSLRRDIHIIHQWIPNDISSTRVRLALQRGLSVKYLLPDLTLDYIEKNGLFGYKKNDE